MLRDASAWGSILILMLLSLLASVWIFGFVGFRIHSFQAPIYISLAYSMVLHILLVVPASLALASKTVVGTLIAVPYLLVLSLHLFAVVMFTGLDAEAFAVARVTTSFHIAWVVPAVIVALLWKIREKTKRQIYSAMFILQVILLGGAIYYFTYQYGVLHLAEPIVSVQRIRFGDGRLGLLLIEKERAYVVNRRGRLYRIDLEQGRKVFIARIPMPEPAEVGLPHLMFRPKGGRYANPFVGVLNRVDDDELFLRFRYRLTGGSWIMGVKIHEESGKVDWQLLGKEDDVPTESPYGIFSLNPVQAVSQGGRVTTLTPDQRLPFTLLVESEGVQTVIDPLGRVDWRDANYGWILVGTWRGGLIIVTTIDR